jgi:23S rRNA U2552 (ribose-2'-O)-methylase RlmE/FtsJ
MNSFVLPNINIANIHDKISVEITDNNIDGIISKILNSYLNRIKIQIDNNQDKWDNYKKYTNTYEYIHTTVPNSKQSVCTLKPLSRSFYKMIEMCENYNIMNDLPQNCKTFHLAEGPGGFIEAIVLLRNNKNDLYYGMTLNDNDTNVPGWKKSNYFLKANSNVIIENGQDNTGNLLNKENLEYCFKKYNNSMDLITADGGFDFSQDFNKQEVTSLKLIYAQVCYAIAMQKKNGTFILKVFDLFTQTSLDILFLLSCLYKNVNIVKPNTSRMANSEKYIICKNFKLETSNMILFELFKSFDYLNTSMNLKRILNIEIPHYFINKIEDCNSLFGQLQIENISSTLNLIDNYRTDKIESLKKYNISKCISWCQKHNLPYNNNIKTVNQFLSR